MPSSLYKKRFVTWIPNNICHINHKIRQPASCTFYWTWSLKKSWFPPAWRECSFLMLISTSQMVSLKDFLLTSLIPQHRSVNTDIKISSNSSKTKKQWGIWTCCFLKVTAYYFTARCICSQKYVLILTCTLLCIYVLRVQIIC